MDNIKNRLKGALYGFAIGDAMGATTEFMSVAEIKSDYEKLTDIVGGGWLDLKAGEVTDVTLSIGDAISHPNTAEHYIAWFKLFFVAEGSKNVVELGDVHFDSHGEANLFTEPKAVFSVKLPSSGKLVALSYCNLHGLWENVKEVTAE